MKTTSVEPIKKILILTLYLEVDVSQLDPQLLQYLAIQRLKQLTSPPGGEAKEDDLWGSRKDTTLKCDDKGQVKQSLVLDAKTKGKLFIRPHLFDL